MEENDSRLAFEEEFKRVSCFCCLRRFCDGVQLNALTCVHIFCDECLTRECRIVNDDPNRRECGACRNVAKCAPFSESLPASFLDNFAPIDFTGFFRAKYFQLRHRKRCAYAMRNRLYRVRNAVQQVYQSGRERHDRNIYVRRVREALRHRLVSAHYYFDRHMEFLLSFSMQELEGMRFTESPRFDVLFANDLIDSSPPLLRQALLRSAAYAHSL